MAAAESEKKPSVLVMMATYNGEKYVAEQIESILNQEGVNVSLLVSDDCSTDNTVAICRELAKQDNRIQVEEHSENVGVTLNFMNMVYGADSTGFDFFAFSDQDDYWLPEKLISAVRVIEAKEDGPHLYYSDILNVDGNLKGDKSEYRSFAPFAGSLKLLFTMNWALGCTMVFNASFLDLLQLYRPSTWPRIHDVWVHLVALSCGCVVPDLNNAYILRRLTGENVVGAKEWGRVGFKRLLLSTADFLSRRGDHYSVEAAENLLRGYSTRMPGGNRLAVEDFINGSKTFVGRIRLAFDKDFKGPYPNENYLYSIKMLLNFY